MEKLAFDKIKETVIDLQKRNEPINHEKFLAWLDQLALDEPALREYRMMRHSADMAFYQAKTAGRESRFKNRIEVRKIMFDSVMSTAVAALKSSLLINGGAAVAMLGFLASIMKEGKNTVVPYEFGYALLSFSVGVFAAVLASSTTYFAQYYYQDGHDKVGNRYRITSIFFVAFSLASFLFGSYEAYLGIYPN